MINFFRQIRVLLAIMLLASISSAVYAAKSLSLNGSTGWVDVGYSNLTNGTTNFTISAWIKTSDTSGVISSKNGSYNFGISGGYLYASSKTAGERSATSTVQVNDNAWHHVVVVQNTTDDDLKLYIDGSLNKTVSSDNAITIGSGANAIGRDRTINSDHLAGLIDELALWNAALDADAVTAMYGSGLGLDPSNDLGNYDYASNLVRYHKFEDNANYTTAGTNGAAYNVTYSTDVYDTTAPTLSASTPADDSTGFGIDSNVVLTFSEPVIASSGWVKIHRSDTSATLTSVAANDTNYVSGLGTNTITINFPISLGTSTGYYLTISSTAFYDVATNVYSGISGAGDLNFTTSSDGTAPTITGTTVASDNSSIAVTFSEAVYNAMGGSGSLEAGDFSLSISGGTATLSSATPSSISANGNTYTLGLPLSGTANGSETITVVPSSSTAIYDAVDNAASTSQSNNTVSLNIASPLGKSDVQGSVKAWTNISVKWAHDNANAIISRLNWLSRHKNSANTSHQGIKLTFSNKIIDAVMNTTPQSKQAIVGRINQHLNPSKQAVNLLSNLENAQGAMLAGGEAITSDAQMIAINEAARLRESAIGSLNPTFKPVYEDWSLWTAGQVTVGEVDATTSSSKQDSKDVTISLGFDKPFYDGGLVGWSLSLGQTKTDIGVSTTQVKSDNYGLSGYSVIKQDNGNTIESILGLGYLRFDTTRKDGSDTLTGKRDANQVFASVTIKNNQATFEQDNWSVTPYGKASASYTELDKFSEASASTALTYHKQTVNEAKVYVGADATYLVTLNNGTITPFAKIEYGRDVSGGSNATMHYNSESAEYTLNLDKAATESWKLGLGTDIQTKDGWIGSFGYEREQAIGSGHSNSFKLDARIAF